MPDFRPWLSSAQRDTASFVKAGICPTGSNAHNSSAKCQEVCDAQHNVGCRAGKGVKMTGKPFVQGMGWETPSWDSCSHKGD